MNLERFEAAAERIATAADQYLPGEKFGPGDVELRLVLTEGGPTYLCVLVDQYREFALSAQSLAKDLDGTQLAEFMADKLDELDTYDPIRGEQERNDVNIILDRLKTCATPTALEVRAYGRQTQTINDLERYGTLLFTVELIEKHLVYSSEWFSSNLETWLTEVPDIFQTEAKLAIADVQRFTSLPNTPDARHCLATALRAACLTRVDRSLKL